MRAAVFDRPGALLRVETLANPKPRADEVVLKIAACGICGSDLHMSTDPMTFGIGQGAVLGHEFSGTVVAIGEAVEDLTYGDRVAVAPMFGCGHCPSCRAGDPAWCPEMRLIGGGYAEMVAVTARQCRKLPATVDLAYGALAEPTAVGMHCIVRSGLKPGERVLILGAGPIGLLVAFWARRMGAGQVIVADINDHQAQRAHDMGASDFVISGPGLDQVLARHGGPPDIVFECVGKKGLIDAAIGHVRVHGRVIGVGLCVGGDQWDPFAALSKEVTIIMSAFFNMHEFAAAIDTLAGGAFSPLSLVTDRVSLASVPETFAALHHRTTQCKVLIDMAAD